MVCVYDDMEMYLDCTKKIYENNKTMFLPFIYNFNSGQLGIFIKNMSSGEGILLDYVKNSCDNLGTKEGGV